MPVSSVPVPADVESATGELHALGIALTEPLQILYGRALAAEAVGLVECLAIQDLLAVAGYEGNSSPHLHSALLALFSARRQGSLCLSLAPTDLARALAPFAIDEAAMAASVLGGLAAGEWSDLVATGATPFRPVVRSGDSRFLYLRKYYLCEARLRERLARLASGREGLLGVAPEAARQLVNEAGEFRGFRLNAAQMWGVYLALRSNFVVITGGPGTGKTTLVTSLLRVLDRCRVRPDRIALIAPTGRAAQRLTEALAAGLAQADEPAERLSRLGELEGTTIHRLLRFQPRRGAFAHDEDYPLPLDVVIVDEVSMVDVALMEKLLAAVRPGALVVFLGDKDQLPSVEAGAVLADLIPAGGTPGYDESIGAELQALTPEVPLPAGGRDGVLLNRVVILTESNRMAGRVHEISLRVNRGDDSVVAELPEAGIEDSPHWQASRADCVLLARHAGNPLALQRTLEDWTRHYWVAPPGQTALVDLLLAAGEAVAEDDAALVPVLERLPQACILTILRHGVFGAVGVNRGLAECFRKRLDPQADNGLLFSGAPVLVTRNTPGLGLFNGDLGVAVRGRDGRLTVLFRRGEQVLRVPAALLPPHELAFALTVHKSQGSEYGNVFLVVPPGSGHQLLTREIIYTAMTRARRLVAIWSRPGVLAQAVRTRVERCSALGLWTEADQSERTSEVLL